MQKFKQKPLLLLILSLIPFLSFAQKQVSHENQQWLQYYNQTKINEKWTWLSDGGYRWKDGFQDKSQYIIRTGFSYNFNPKVSVAAGLAHLGLYSPSGNLNKIEIRPYQELDLKGNWGKVSISHRYRIEERYFQLLHIDGLPDPTSFNLRFRYRFFSNFPIWQRKDKKLSVNLGDEIFINTGKEIEFNVFDQNRLLIGPAFQMNNKLSASLMLSCNYSSGNAPKVYKYSNTFWLAIQHKVDLTKKKER